MNDKNINLANKIIKELFDITGREMLYLNAFDDQSITKYFFRRRLIKENLEYHFRVLSVIDKSIKEILIVYFIYNNKYCRLVVAENINYAKFLSEVKYEK
jgi:hypothetical protein